MNSKGFSGVNLLAKRGLLAAVVFVAISLSIVLASAYRFRTPKSTIKQLRPILSSCPQSSTELSKGCNPFVLPGYIENDVWTPMLSESCAPVNKSSLDSLIPHLRNKRYYFYGDSVLRNAAQDFCDLLGAPAESLPNPEGYLTTSDKQAIHYCHLESVNFTAVNIFTFGMKEWDETDLPFLLKHGSINHNSEDDPRIWTFEDRMMTPHSTLVSMFGTADVVLVSSGLWDLPYLQRYVTAQAEQNNIPQTEAPPNDFLSYYATRIRGYIQLARRLHSPKKVFMVTLHDPKEFDIKRSFGMEGYASDNVEFSCLAEPRVRALREAQIAAAAAEPADVEALAYDRLVRASHPDQRMRDGIHPSAYANEFLSMAAIVEAKNLHRPD